MSDCCGLVAWIEPKDGRCAAAFVSEATRGLRAPATQLFSSIREARGWVQREPAALDGGVPVVSVDQSEALATQLLDTAGHRFRVMARAAALGRAVASEIFVHTILVV
jgi:hypothetical protein